MSDSELQTTVGTGDYQVQQGDCLLNVAKRAGHFWQTLWNHPANANLKSTRGDPNILLPGDLLTIPPITLKQEAKPTDQRHKFIRKGMPAKLRLRVMIEDDDGTGSGPVLPKPRRNQPYQLQIDGKLFTGTTDGDGYLEVAIPPQASQGNLVIGPDNMTVKLVLGGLDPATTLSGMQGRLNNLGFNAGEANGQMNTRTRAALKMFQLQYGLEATGNLDDATSQKLKQVHGS